MHANGSGDDQVKTQRCYSILKEPVKTIFSTRNPAKRILRVTLFRVLNWTTDIMDKWWDRITGSDSWWRTSSSIDQFHTYGELLKSRQIGHSFGYHVVTCDEWLPVVAKVITSLSRAKSASGSVRSCAWACRGPPQFSSQQKSNFLEKCLNNSLRSRLQNIRSEARTIPLAPVSRPAPRSQDPALRGWLQP